MNQDWREELGAFLEEKRKDKKEERRLELERFLQDVALAAFRELKGELEKHGRLATIREAPASASIKVTPQIAGEAILLAISTTLLASIYPAWRASRLVIVDALRHNR